MSRTRTRGGPAAHQLTGELTIQTAAERKPALLALLEAGDDVVLDLGQVTELDTAGLQLLLLLKREAAQQGRGVRLTGVSGPVDDLLAIAHLTTDLETAP